MGFRSAGSLLSCESESAASDAGAASVECVATSSSSRAIAHVVVVGCISMLSLMFIDVCYRCRVLFVKEEREREQREQGERERYINECQLMGAHNLHTHQQL